MLDIHRLLLEDDADLDYKKYSPEVLNRYFGYKVRPSEHHFRILKLAELYYVNNEKFMKKGYLEPGIRAREALRELRKLVVTRRIEILEDMYRIRAEYRRLRQPENYKENVYALKSRLRKKDNQQ